MLAPKGRLWAQISAFDQNSKDFLKNLKYFLGSGSIFEKKNGAQKGPNQGFLGIFPVLPYFHYFTLFSPILGYILGCGD